MYVLKTASVSMEVHKKRHSTIVPMKKTGTTRGWAQMQRLEDVVVSVKDFLTKKKKIHRIIKPARSNLGKRVQRSQTKPKKPKKLIQKKDRGMLVMGWNASHMVQQTD